MYLGRRHRTGDRTYPKGPCRLPIMASAPSLWRPRDFLLLWGGQSVSRIGDHFPGLAVPYMAAYVLLASPAEMGLLGAAGTVPFLLFGLLVGVWVDRRQRRSVLIFADIGRGAMIATIALLGIANLLQLLYLYILSFFIGVLTVFFDVAYQAYLPALVGRQQLVDANSKLETSNTLANTAGPTVAGAVIDAFRAPFAMLVHRRHPWRGNLRPDRETDRRGSCDHSGRGPFRHSYATSRLRPSRYRPPRIDRDARHKLLWKSAIQHQPGELPSGDCPHPAARSTQRDDANNRLGHLASRRLDRGLPRRGDRSPSINIHWSRRGRVCVPLGSLLARPPDPRNARIRGVRRPVKTNPAERTALATSLPSR